MRHRYLQNEARERGKALAGHRPVCRAKMRRVAIDYEIARQSVRVTHQLIISVIGRRMKDRSHAPAA